MFKRNPLTLFRRPDLYISLSADADKGRGVFCHNDIKAGEVIEVAPLMLFDEEETNLLMGATKLRDYVFGVSDKAHDLCKREKVKDYRKASFFAMGITSFCNHSRKPNADAEFTDEYHTGFYTLKATADIPKDTEISVHYGTDWFIRRQGKPLPGEG